MSIEISRCCITEHALPIHGMCAPTKKYDSNIVLFALFPFGKKICNHLIHLPCVHAVKINSMIPTFRILMRQSIFCGYFGRNHKLLRDVLSLPAQEFHPLAVSLRQGLPNLTMQIQSNFHETVRLGLKVCVLWFG